MFTNINSSCCNSLIYFIILLKLLPRGGTVPFRHPSPPGFGNKNLTLVTNRDIVSIVKIYMEEKSAICRSGIQKKHEKQERKHGMKRVWLVWALLLALLCSVFMTSCSEEKANEDVQEHGGLEEPSQMLGWHKQSACPTMADHPLKLAIGNLLRVAELFPLPLSSCLLRKQFTSPQHPWLSATHCVCRSRIAFGNLAGKA